MVYVMVKNSETRRVQEEDFENYVSSGWDLISTIPETEEDKQFLSGVFNLEDEL